MPARFLAIHDLPPDATPTTVRAQLHRLAHEARHRGVLADETVYSLDKHRAYTLCEGTEPAVRETYASARVPLAEVVPAERVFTWLLSEPNRAR